MREDREPDLTAVILCGGKSRRMGRDKAGLMMDGRSLLQRLTEALAPLGDLWLSVQSPEEAPESPLPKVADRFSDGGPMAGLEAALSVCRNELLFVTAVDMPFVDAPLALELAARLRRAPDLDALLVVDAGGRRQYLLGVYRKRVHPRLLARLEEGGRESQRISSFLEEIHTAFLPAEELTEGAFKARSCNTWEEYQALVRLAEGTEGE